MVSSKRCYDAQVMNFLEGESEGVEHSHEESFQGADHLQRRSACERSLTEIGGSSGSHLRDNPPVRDEAAYGWGRRPDRRSLARIAS